MVFSIFILPVFLNDLHTSVAIKECWRSYSMLRGVVWGQNWMNALICTDSPEEVCIRSVMNTKQRQETIPGSHAAVWSPATQASSG